MGDHYRVARTVRSPAQLCDDAWRLDVHDSQVTQEPGEDLSVQLFDIAVEAAREGAGHTPDRGQRHADSGQLPHLVTSCFAHHFGPHRVTRRLRGPAEKKPPKLIGAAPSAPQIPADALT